MSVCDTPDLGRIKKVGVFLLDDCMAPIYGDGAGYLDDCPAGVSSDDNVDDGTDFTRRCADGSIKRYIPGVKSLQSIGVDLDFNWIDPQWVALAGGASPIIHDGEVIGWGDSTSDRFNVLVAVWQELLGEDSCGAGVAGADYVRLYPLKGARFTEDGDIGAEDNVTRISGDTVANNNLGSGPIPLARDEVTGDAEWISNCLSGDHRYRFIGAAAPDGCGIVDTIEPDDPCTPAS